MSQVKEFMSKKPEYLAPNTTLQEAANEMKKHNIGSIPVGEDDRLVGFITDRDITTRAVAKGENPNTPIKNVMTKKVLYVFEDDDVQKAIDTMAKQGIHRLIVLNKDKRLTGIFSLSDLARKSTDLSLCGRAIKTIAESQQHWSE